MDSPILYIGWMIHPNGLELQSRRAAAIAVLTAASISTNYLLIGVVNVKLMDLIVFSSGYIYGCLAGVMVGVLTWLVYGTLNPYGFSLPILIATMLCETLYGVVGGLLARRGFWDGGFIDGAVSFGVLGFLLTSIYDLMTNIVSGLVAGVPIAVALIAGVPFALIHEISNALLFSLGAPPLIRVLRRFGGDIYGR